jgi:multicomponent Na+:H+ antiporter subunit C
MIVPLALLVGLLFGAAAYLMLDRNFVRYLFGLVLLGTATNLLLFVVGGLTAAAPAIVPEGMQAPPEVVANALPQALILTAIVISFALLAFALVLAVRAYSDLGTVDTDRMRASEPLPGEGDPEAES